MKKWIKCNVIFLFIISFILMNFSYAVYANTEDNNDLDIEAKSALLMEPTTGKIIYSKNIHEKFAPASVTKIMTMLLTMEAIDSGKIKLSDKVTVSENAKKMGGSSMLLDTGEVRTVEELLKGVAIASGNDAAVALAEYIGGSQSNFVSMMNKRAKELGMKDTNFENCHGLSAPGHLSTAYDISIMSRELLKHPKILEYTSIYMETISEGRKTPIGLVNKNKLVRFFKGCDGLKTGYTGEAKYCISATATRDGVRMLAIIMGAPTLKGRNRDASKLLNYGFSKFQVKRVLTKGETVEKIYLNKKRDKFFNAKSNQDLNVIVEKGANTKITLKCVINKNMKEFIKDKEVGYCEVYVDNKLYKKIPIYSDRDIKAYTILDIIKNNFKQFFYKAV